MIDSEQAKTLGVLLSLALGIYNLYISQIRGFRLSAYAASVIVRREPIGAAEEGKHTLTLTVPIQLSNRGARWGCVEDFRLRVKGVQAGTQWTFGPQFFADLAKFPEGMAQSKSSWELSSAPFHPICLSSYESISKAVIFGPLDVSLDSLQTDDYSVTLEAKSVGRDYVPQCEFTISVTAGRKDQVDLGKALVTTAKAVTDARRR